MSKELREKFLPLTVVNNSNLNDDEKIVDILTNSDLQKTAKFIYMAFENRDLCLDVPSTVNDIIDYVEDICLKTQHEDNVIMPYRVKM